MQIYSMDEDSIDSPRYKRGFHQQVYSQNRLFLDELTEPQQMSVHLQLASKPKKRETIEK